MGQVGSPASGWFRLAAELHYGMLAAAQVARAARWLGWPGWAGGWDQGRGALRAACAARCVLCGVWCMLRDVLCVS